MSGSGGAADWLEAELADTLDEDYELELSEPALSLEIAQDLPQDATRPRSRARLFPRAAAAAGRADQAAGLGAYHKEKVVVIFEGRDSAGKGGVIKRITQRLNPRVVPRRGAAGAVRPREDPVVLPALRAASARRRRDRAVRPLLVQPLRRRAGHGLRHRGPGRAVLPRRARVRAHAGALGHPAGQVLVLDHRRGAADALPDAHPRSAEAVEAVADGPAEPRALGGTTPRPRRRRSPAPTSPRRPGTSSRATTRSARG